jgi:hypothetical protein
MVQVGLCTISWLETAESTILVELIFLSMTVAHDCRPWWHDWWTLPWATLLLFFSGYEFGFLPFVVARILKDNLPQKLLLYGCSNSMRKWREPKSNNETELVSCQRRDNGIREEVAAAAVS